MITGTCTATQTDAQTIFWQCPNSEGSIQIKDHYIPQANQCTRIQPLISGGWAS